ncbi:hypothetical protein EG68_00877 [Paragonimus skrjabini miyazakii]|uniref:Uncharacterized protein n=1 Tax=Paragonimus skrjabini miyazakii TaxID=59628 RepID=A0A8S9Z2Z4_9TREM|nr:hypothetical protein EG68_00877 [Paragonimus skrjabini miyazakii]
MVGDQKGTKESGGRRILLYHIPILSSTQYRTFFNEDSTQNGQSLSLKSTTGNQLAGSVREEWQSGGIKNVKTSEQAETRPAYSMDPSSAWNSRDREDVAHVRISMIHIA